MDSAFTIIRVRGSAPVLTLPTRSGACAEMSAD